MTLLITALACYAVMSLVTFVTYLLDKRAAQRGRQRTPEATLHVLELLGGWPGAFLAQRLIRHKNAKLSYQIVFWLIVALHVAVWIVLIQAGLVTVGLSHD